MIGPNDWGPHGWKFIHYVTMGYPDKPTQEDKNKYKNFLVSIGDVLPCIICANHYKEHLIEYPIDENVLKNNKNLMEWGIMVHNAVNRNNGKKVLSFNEALKSIYQNDDTCKITIKKNNYYLFNLLPILIFGLILIIQLSKNKRI